MSSGNYYNKFADIVSSMSEQKSSLERVLVIAIAVVVLDDFL